MSDYFQSTYHIGEVWCPNCVHGRAPCFRYTPHDGSCLYYQQIGTEKRKRLSDGAVDWYVPGRKKPFARTTKAVAELIYHAYKEEPDFRAVLGKVSYSEEARKVVEGFIRRKIYILEVKK